MLLGRSPALGSLLSALVISGRAGLDQGSRTEHGGHPDKPQPPQGIRLPCAGDSSAAVGRAAPCGGANRRTGRQIHEARGIRSRAEIEGDTLSLAGREVAYQQLRNRVGCQRLGAVCESITDGDHNTPIFTETGVRFIFVGNVSSGRLHPHGSKRVSEDYFDRLSPQRVPKPGDILYSAVGATLGIPAVVDVDDGIGTTDRPAARYSRTANPGSASR